VQGGDGGARRRVGPDRRTDATRGRGPRGVQAAGAERGLRLAAAAAPRRSDGSPAVTAHVAYESIGIAKRERSLATQAFGRQDELFDRLKPPRHAAPRRASHRAAAPDPERNA